ncbi:MAG TPA: hypothetical protein VGM91_06580 [Conexibacter sp.]|jgi:NhaP-type Na+/H+ or K+/H+ antiporter
MIGTHAHAHAHAPSVAFLRWFGPRGLASIVFAVIVVRESNLPHVSTILVTTYVTVGSPCCSTASRPPRSPTATRHGPLIEAIDERTAEIEHPENE